MTVTVVFLLPHVHRQTDRHACMLIHRNTCTYVNIHAKRRGENIVN